MRDWYLKKPTYVGGCRGGIRNKDGEDWGLEIGQDQYANTDLFAIAVLHDEIVEFLETRSYTSVLAASLYRSYLKLTEEISESLRNKG